MDIQWEIIGPHLAFKLGTHRDSNRSKTDAIPVVTVLQHMRTIDDLNTVHWDAKEKHSGPQLKKMVSDKNPCICVHVHVKVQD